MWQTGVAWLGLGVGCWHISNMCCQPEVILKLLPNPHHYGEPMKWTHMSSHPCWPSTHDFSLPPGSGIATGGSMVSIARVAKIGSSKWEGLLTRCFEAPTILTTPHSYTTVSGQPKVVFFTAFLVDYFLTASMCLSLGMKYSFLFFLIKFKENWESLTSTVRNKSY